MPHSPQQDLALDSWLGKNLRWIVPISLGLILGSLIMISVSFVFNAIHRAKTSDIYRLALAKTLSRPELTLQLGLPIREGWLVWKNGETDIRFTLKGTGKNAEIYTSARKINGEWSLQTLTAIIEPGNKSMDILALTSPDSNNRVTGQ